MTELFVLRDVYRKFLMAYHSFVTSHNRSISSASESGMEPRVLFVLYEYLLQLQI
jgi:hypothetical protein